MGYTIVLGETWASRSPQPWEKIQSLDVDNLDRQKGSVAEIFRFVDKSAILAFLIGPRNAAALMQTSPFEATWLIGCDELSALGTTENDSPSSNLSPHFALRNSV